MKLTLFGVSSAAILMTLVAGELSPALAQQPRFQVGRLTCRLGPSVGLLLGSRQRMDCRFKNATDRRIEHYAGTATRFGIDIGVTAGGVLAWSVLTHTRRIAHGALAGHYFGASGDASVGVGIGAKALIGGSRRTTMLQPISVSGRIGLNVAAGITGLELQYVSGR